MAGKARILFLCTGNSCRSQMAEVGVDISAHTSDAIAEYVADPADARGSDEEVRVFFRRVRDEIRGRLQSWIDEGFPPLALQG